jgi:transcriptional regulator with XRE-family HTH domain
MMKSEFSQLLREARKKRNFTQKQLAEKLEVATGTVQQWELGVRFPRVEMLAKLERELGISFLPENSDINKIAIQLGVPYETLYSIVDEGTDEEALDKIEQIRNSIEKIQQPMKAYEDFLHSSDKASPYAVIMWSFSRLNKDGQRVAVERVEELTQIPKYQRTEPPEAPEAEKEGE